MVSTVLRASGTCPNPFAPTGRSPPSDADNSERQHVVHARALAVDRATTPQAHPASLLELSGPVPTAPAAEWRGTGGTSGSRVVSGETGRRHERPRQKRWGRRRG